MEILYEDFKIDSPKKIIKEIKELEVEIDKEIQKLEKIFKEWND